MKTIERLLLQPFAKLTNLQSKKTDLIRDLFNWSDMLGTQMKLISNREGITDTNYYTRTLKFECMRPNSLQRGIMNNGYEFNKR